MLIIRGRFENLETVGVSVVDVIQSAIVVIADTHNPSILHPSFLEAQQIVPASWTLSEPPICTPAFSSVKYRNGVTIVSELNKLQIGQDLPLVDATHSESVGVAERYVEKLPHVRYRAAGVNFVGFMDHEDGEEFVTSRFIKPGYWTQPEFGLRESSVLLISEADGARLKLTFEGNSVPSAGGAGKRNGVLITGNYHVDVASDDALAATKRVISSFAEKYNHFMREVSRIVSD